MFWRCPTLFDPQAISGLWTDYFTLPWIARGSSDEALAGAVGGIADGLSGDLAKNFSVSAKTKQTVENVQKGFLPGLGNATAVHKAAVVGRLVATCPVRSSISLCHQGDG